MAVRYALAFLCLVAIALFSALARKFWKGEGLELIAGNQFAGRAELGLPYQRRLARECSVMLAACNFALVLLALGILCSADARTLLLAALAFAALVTMGAIAISARADRAAKADQAEACLQVGGDGPLKTPALPVGRSTRWPSPWLSPLQR